MVQTQKPFAVVTLCGASAVDECNDKKVNTISSHALG